MADSKIQGAVGILPERQEKPPERQADASPLNGVVPPVEYRWKPGQSGNPNVWKDLEPPGPAFERALRKAIQRRPDLVEAAVMKALEGAADGDLKALEQLWSREVGKPKQGIEHTGSVTSVTITGAETDSP